MDEDTHTIYALAAVALCVSQNLERAQLATLVNAVPVDLALLQSMSEGMKFAVTQTDLDVDEIQRAGDALFERC